MDLFTPVIGSLPTNGAGVLDDGPYSATGLASLLVGLGPGPACIAVLAGVEVGRLNDDDRHAVLDAWRRCEAWVAAASQGAVVAAAESTGLVADDPSFLAVGVGLTLRVPLETALSRIDVARALTGTFAGTQLALEFGDISMQHARVMVELCDRLDAATVARIEAKVLPKAADQTVSAFRRCVRRALMREAPDAMAAAAESAVRTRDVVMYAGEDCMATVAATMPAADAQTVFLAIDTLAHLARDRARDAEQPGGLIDERGIGAWRADVLLSWANEVLADPGLPKRHGRRVRVEVVIDLPTLLGMAEHPCELVGYGPIPAPMARELAVDAEWQRFVVDPTTGQLLDVGRRIYRPSQRLTDFVVARDRRCRFPSCTRRATHCDIDHVDPHGRGGETTRRNCVCLCRRHHRMKTFGGWLLTVLSDGALLWTAPGGRTYLTPARRFLDTG